MKCEFCGEELQENFKYCTNCGMPVKVKKAENKNVEYFEILEKKKEPSKYDFSGFLEDYKKEEEKEFKESQRKRPIFNKENVEDKEDFDKDNTSRILEDEEEDNLEDTKKRRLFERTDYDLFESIRENKSKSFYEEEKSSSNFFERFKKKGNSKKEEPKSQYSEEKFYDKDSFEDERDFREDYVPEGFIPKSELKRLRRQNQMRTVTNFIFNIIVFGVVLFVCFTGAETFKGFFARYFSIFDGMSPRFFIALTTSAALFLLIPFFKCRGNAKVPLLIFSILISWTLLGWIVLMIVATISNRKWDKRVRDLIM
ncbi:hypothetical protein [Lagierella sp.]|uniref:zinc-ribbon domain-containing protein n=1 Tax=Lagierella sp. TaxID=2849657 RepID=UPI00261E7065|nr:hypothetical protein [Lagierella sp.]